MVLFILVSVAGFARRDRSIGSSVSTQKRREEILDWEGTEVGQGKKDKKYENGIMFIACFILVRPLVVVLYTFVEAYSSSRLNVETWACGVGEEKVCKELKAARWILVPVVVLAGGLLGVVIWRRVRSGKEGVRRRRGVREEGKV